MKSISVAYEEKADFVLVLHLLLDGFEKLLDFLDVLRDIAVIIHGGWLLLRCEGGEVDPAGDALVDAEGRLSKLILLGCGLALHFLNSKYCIAIVKSHTSY